MSVKGIDEEIRAFEEHLRSKDLSKRTIYESSSQGIPTHPLRTSKGG